MNGDDLLSLKDQLFLGMFLILYFVVPAILVWASYTESRVARGIDLHELWTHNGRADKLAVIILGSWWVHTCTIILWTLSKSITTADFITYMGWALPIIAKMFSPDHPPPPQQPGATP